MWVVCPKCPRWVVTMKALVIASVILAGSGMSCTRAPRGQEGRQGSGQEEGNRLSAPRRVSDPKPGLGWSWKEYVGRIIKASSDEERWAATEQHFNRSFKPADFEGSASEFAVAYGLYSLGRLGEFWLLHYPGITKRTSITVAWLESYGDHIESSERWEVWCEEGRDAGIRRLCTTMMSEGEIARGWLRYLVGVDFETKAEFKAWLAKNKHLLRWNQTTGKFDRIDPAPQGDERDLDSRSTTVSSSPKR